MSINYVGKNSLTRFLEKLYETFSKKGHAHSKADILDFPSMEGLATESYVDTQIETIEIPDVSGQINIHNTSTDAHNDIRQMIGEKVYAQTDEPTDAPDGSIWVDMDAIAEGEIQITLDTSLTVEGQAADAKAVGDAIYNISEQLADSGSIDIDLDTSNSGEITPINADTLGGVAAENFATKDHEHPEYIRKITSRNLLDNSDFRNPVNQRGQTSLTSVGYFIDRWATEHSDNPNLSLGDGYLTVGTGHITQRVPEELIDGNKIYTIAAMKVDGTLLVASGRASDTIRDGDRLVFTYIYDMWRFYIIEAGDYLWAALYEGEYTLDTLPEYHPKGYGVELAECQRYFLTGVGAHTPGHAGVKSDKRFFINIPTPVTMRVNPTATLDLADNVVFGTTSGYSVNNITGIIGAQKQNNSVFIEFGLGSEPPQHYAVGSTFSTSLTLSADL